MLRKIPFRIMWRDKAHFIGIILLVFLASFGYALFSILITNIDTNYKNFVEKYNQENFHFTTFFPVDIEGLEKKYNVLIEEKFTWDFEFGEKIIRFFNITEKVNKPLILEGSMPQIGEIALDPNFLNANKLKIGDEIEILGKSFKISGAVALPDYIYITKNENDLLPDPIHFGIGIMNFEDMKKFLGNIAYRYYMVRGKISDLDSFKSEVNSKYTLLNFQEKDENFRIIVTEMKMESARPMSYVISFTIMIISSILLFIVLRRLINSMHAEIGTLYALGYDRKELLKTYIMFPIYIWILGSIPGGALGYVLSDPFTKFYVSFISVPVVEKFFPLTDLFIAIFIPALFMLPSGYIAIRDLLRRSVVEIIRGESEKGFKSKFRMKFLDRFSFRRRIMLKQGLLHPSRELVLIIGVAFATLIIMYGVVAKTALSYLVEDTFENIFKYNYMYLFNYYEKEKNYPKAEPFNMLSFYLKGTKAKVVIYGIEKDSQMIILKDKHGNRLKLEGLVIAQSLADKFNLKEGDIINIVNNIDGKEYSLKINKIADLYVGNSGYMILDDFNKTFNMEEGSFIGLYSMNKLNIPKENLVSSFSKEDIIKSFRDSAQSVDQMLQVMYMLSFFLAFIIIYVLSALVITENRKPLGIFKILGYKDGELSSMFLGFNNFSFIVGFLLGIPLFNTLMGYIMNEALKDVDFSFKLQPTIRDILFSFSYLFVAFLLSRYLGRRRIKAISPHVILKEQSE
ncbi:MAG: FtsX-like permease family protein [Dictyoglomus sp.]|nr:FtsX-like permease family protein [Dictyoglomus sp.]MDW8189210.1 FtsX-like permease family protein [Dictyoglomus sp.]